MSRPRFLGPIFSTGLLIAVGVIIGVFALVTLAGLSWTLTEFAMLLSGRGKACP